MLFRSGGWRNVYGRQTRQAVRADGGPALRVVYRAEPNALRRRVRLAGLSEDAQYQAEGEERIYSGAALMAGGILLPEIKGDDAAVQIYLRRLSAS